MFIPRPGHYVAEIHLTYRCNLNCSSCNSFGYLRPSTPDMTVDDMTDFLRQANELQWHPHNSLFNFVGGEPTQHDDLLECLALTTEFVDGDITKVKVWSNGYGQRAKGILQRVANEQLATVVKETQKAGSVKHEHWDMCVAPVDCGVDTRTPCWTHASHGKCGISVDAKGYILCPCGGAIDGVLRLNLRTKDLAKLYEHNFAEQQTKSICRWCGLYINDKLPATSTEIICGTTMSSSWSRAAKRLQTQG